MLSSWSTNSGEIQAVYHTYPKFLPLCVTHPPFNLNFLFIPSQVCCFPLPNHINWSDRSHCLSLQEILQEVFPYKNSSKKSFPTKTPPSNLSLQSTFSGLCSFSSDARTALSQLREHHKTLICVSLNQLLPQKGIIHGDNPWGQFYSQTRAELQGQPGKRRLFVWSGGKPRSIHALPEFLRPPQILALGQDSQPKESDPTQGCEPSMG